MPTHTIAGRSEQTRPPIRLSFVRWTALSTAALAFLAIGVYVGATRLGATLRLAGASADPSPVALLIGGSYVFYDSHQNAKKVKAGHTLTPEDRLPMAMVRPPVPHPRTPLTLP